MFFVILFCIYLTFFIFALFIKTPARREDVGCILLRRDCVDLIAVLHRADKTMLVANGGEF